MGEPALEVTVAEYLALDAAEEHRRFEYLNGIVVAMAGGSPRHSAIAACAVTALSNALASGPCRVFDSNMRVRLGEAEAYVYPDVSVGCGELSFTNDRPPTLENPTFVVEVLSGSTRGHDVGAKLEHYRQVASVQEVLLIESVVRRVTLYRRIERRQWLLEDFDEGRVELKSLGVHLEIDALYAKTEDLPAE